MGELTAISHTLHADHRWKPYPGYSFAASDEFAPLVVNEIARAALSAPVAFMMQDETCSVVMVQGFDHDQNLLVGKQGEWLGRYVPARYRSYPFCLAVDEGGKLLLCYRTGSEFVSDDFPVDGTNCFFDGGKISGELQSVLNFLNAIEGNKALTSNVCQLILKLDLLKPWELSVRLDDSRRSISGLYCIDESKLAELDESELASMRDSGLFGVVYAQLLSMQNTRLLEGLYAHGKGRNELTDSRAVLEQMFEAEAMTDTLNFDFLQSE